MGKSEFRWTKRRRRFVERYCVHFVGAKAAREAGFSANRDKQTAHELLEMAPIREAIDQRMRELSMSAAEATLRLTNWGRGTIEPFLAEGGGVDLSSEEARAAIGLVKKLKVKERQMGEDGPIIERRTELELHDAKDAVDKIVKIHGLYRDEGAPIDVRVLLVRDVDDVKPEKPE